MTKQPDLRPERPFFSSGPTAKPPGWSPDKLDFKSLGRSHRSKYAKGRLKYAIDLTRELLGVPDDYLCLLYTSPSPRDRQKSRMPSSA